MTHSETSPRLGEIFWPRSSLPLEQKTGIPITKNKLIERVGRELQGRHQGAQEQPLKQLVFFRSEGQSVLIDLKASLIRPTVPGRRGFQLQPPGWRALSG
jgi:hypothetical protein